MNQSDIQWRPDGIAACFATYCNDYPDKSTEYLLQYTADILGVDYFDVVSAVVEDLP